MSINFHPSVFRLFDQIHGLTTIGHKYHYFRVLEGLETAMFKQYFSSWVDASDVDSDEPEDKIVQWNVEDLHKEARSDFHHE